MVKLEFLSQIAQPPSKGFLSQKAVVSAETHSRGSPGGKVENSPINKMSVSPLLRFGEHHRGGGKNRRAGEECYKKMLSGQATATAHELRPAQD